MSAPYRLTASTGIDPGDRPYQQDQLCLLPHGRVKGCVLGVIADGMGGLSGGRLAAEQVMLTAQQLFERFDPASEGGVGFLQQLAQEANGVIRLTAVAAEQEPHSTLAAFLLLPGGACHFAHVGDSRLYHVRGSELLHRSRDHSLLQSLLDRGELSAEQARSDPRSNLLQQCLGTDPPPLPTLHQTPPLQAGDCLLACSDGLWQHLHDAEIAAVLQRHSARTACEMLLREARRRAHGTGDNLSLIVLKLEASPP